MTRERVLNPTPRSHLIQRAYECAFCDPDSDVCKTCDCSSGGDCVLKTTCEQNCAGGPQYTCSWNTTNPQCVQGGSGHMTKDACMSMCHSAKYGKCDFQNNVCVECTPGADKDCIQLMSYCQAAQKEGRCKKQPVTGLYRMHSA